MLAIIGLGNALAQNAVPDSIRKVVPKGYIVISRSQSDEALFRLSTFTSIEQSLRRENKFLRLLNQNLINENQRLGQIDSVAQQNEVINNRIKTKLINDIQLQHRKTVLFTGIGFVTGYIIKTLLFP